MSSLGIWIEATRPRTLPAAVCPVLVGSALAFRAGGFDWLPALLCLTFALLVQIGTNFANDYLDGVKGTDTNERIGPRRAVASGLIQPQAMKVAAVGVLAVAFCLGLFLIPFGGWWLLAIGIASVLCAWLYTGGPYPLAYNGLGDVFVVLFFGFVAVGCTYYLQAGELTFDALLLGLVCGLLINNLLVVNNLRDLKGDRLANKRTTAVLLGRRWALALYIGSILLAALVLLWLFASNYGAWVWLGLLPLIYGLRVYKLLVNAKDPSSYGAALKGTALVVSTFGVLMAFAFSFDRF